MVVILHISPNKVTIMDSTTIDKFPTGTVLRVAVEEWVPHVRVETLQNGSIKADGPMFEILKLLSSVMNFRYVLYRTKDGFWGAPLENGDWSGMMGMVKRNEVDIALGPFIISEQRANAVQFSSIFYIDYFRMMFARKPPVADPLSFLQTYTPSAWLLVLFSFAMLTAMIIIANYYTEENDKICKLGFKQSIGKLFFDMLGLFFQQDLTYDPKKSSIRVIVVCMFVLNLVILKNFSSALTSLLAVKVSPIEFNTFEDLVKDNSYKFVLEASTVITSSIQTSSPQSKLLFGQLKVKENEGNLIEVKIGNLQNFVTTDVKNKKMALFVEETTCFKYTSDIFSESGLCEFYLAEEKVLPSNFGIIGQKGSPIIPKIDKVFQHIIEANLYYHWLSKEISNASTCLDKSSFIHFSVEPFNLHGLWIMFAILACGLLISSLVAAVEVSSTKLSTFL